jgi:hypothetical protein
MANSELHLRIDFSEALNAKKSLLSTKITFLQAIQIIESYFSNRKKELAMKVELKDKIKEINNQISELIHQELPRVTGEETKFGKESVKISKDKNLNKKEKKNRSAIEFELREIKRKLEELDNLR